MSKITTNAAFKESLSSLTLAHQRVVGARFIANVLDLTQNRHIKQAQALLSNTDISAEDLDEAYHSIYSIYVNTHPRSHFSLLDYNKQAEHFVAEACLYSLAPTYSETKKHHLAEKVSMYCLMARTCASIIHEGNYPEFTDTEGLVKKEVDAQYEILSEYLESI
jgi:effector-binding domain-containing protein